MGQQEATFASLPGAWRWSPLPTDWALLLFLGAATSSSPCLLVAICQLFGGRAGTGERKQVRPGTKWKQARGLLSCQKQSGGDRVQVLKHRGRNYGEHSRSHMGQNGCIISHHHPAVSLAYFISILHVLGKIPLNSDNADLNFVARHLEL